MKVLSRIDGSICGAILSTRPSATRAAVSSRLQLRDNRPPGAPASHSRREHTRDARKQCSHCPQTASWLLSTFLPTPAPPSRRPRLPTQSISSCRQRRQRYSHATAAAAAWNSRPEHSVIQRKDHLLGFVERPGVNSPLHPPQKKEDLLDFVEQDDMGTVEEHLELIEDPFLNRYARPEPTRLTISDDRAATEYHQTIPHDSDLGKFIYKLHMTANMRRKFPTRVSLDTIYDMYSALPQPRMLHISGNLRRLILRVFGAPLKKNAKAMLRYFSIIGDVKDAGLSLKHQEWNYAMALASRYVGRTTATETESALQLWREMETKAEIKGNEVTFNILFDAASKAGNFELAQMIYDLMESRGIPFNRFHHVSLIHFFGLKRDPDGIRAAYKETVEAGELIDTAVLNCLISSFLRCGDIDAALRVYEHMKATHSNAASQPYRNYYSDQIITQTLKMFTRIGKNHPALRPQLQAVTITTPDLRTFRVMIYHYAVNAGNLARVAQLLDEMKWFGVPVHGGIFVTIFEGFYTHAEVNPDWSEWRLQKVLEALLQAIDQQVEGVYLDTWLMMWALRAFKKCTTKDVVMDVYDEFKKRWDLKPDKVQHMDSYIQYLLAGGRGHREDQIVRRRLY